MTRRTLDELEQLAFDAPNARVEVDSDAGIAVLVVNGKDSGDYASLDPNEGCDCTELCSMGPTCPGGMLARLPGSGCWRGGVA